MVRRSLQPNTCGVKFPVTVGRVIGFARAKRGKLFPYGPEVEFLREVGQALRPEWREWYLDPFRGGGTDSDIEAGTAVLLSELRSRPLDQVIWGAAVPSPRKRQGGRVETPRSADPVTVRDAQRMVSTPDKLGNPYTREIHKAAYAALDMPCGEEGVMACTVNVWARHEFEATGQLQRGFQVRDRSLEVCQRFFDHLASIDPSQVVLEVDPAGRHRPVGRFAPKGTAEVREQGENPSGDSQFHGGDGNSMEVEGFSKTSGQMRPRAAGGTSGDCSVSGNTAENPCAGETQPQASGSPSAANSPSGAGDTADSTALSAASLRRSGQCLPTDRANASRDGHSGQGSQRPIAGVSPKTENWAKSFSGCTLEMAQVKTTPALIKRAQQAFRRVLDTGNDQDSPRRDYGEFCTRLKTFRNPSPARREEQGRPAILVVVDTSPSVGAIAREALAAAKAVGALGVPGSDVIVVNADNGRPMEVEVNGKPRPLFAVGGVDRCRTEADESAFYRRVCARWDVKVVALIGDGDDAQCRAAVLPHAGLLRGIYMSSYCCSYGSPRKDPAPQWMLDGVKAPKSTARKLVAWDRCATAADFVRCLEG